jgi:hypothetical protein
MKRDFGTLFVIFAGMAIGFLFGYGMATGNNSDHKCEFTVPYMVYPALIIKCDEGAMIGCDTLYTYSDWGSRK